MESRITEPSSTAPNRFKTLPDELQLAIFSLLSTPDILSTQETCHRFHKLLNDHGLWRAKYNKEFHITSFNNGTDHKLQYQAAYLFYRAGSFKTEERKQIGMLKFYHFIQNCHQPWSHYYRGFLHFKGAGTKKDTRLGLSFLQKALRHHDEQAAIEIVEILIASRTNDTNLYNELIKTLNDHKLLDLLLKLLLDTHQPTINLTVLLGCLYAFGIGVPEDFSIAESYYLEAGISDPTMFAELSYLKFHSLSKALSGEQKAERTITYFETLRKKIPQKPLEDIINYWSAYLAINHGDHQTAIQLLATIDTPLAKIVLAHLHEQYQHPRLAAQLLIELIGTENNIAGELFDLTDSPLPQRIITIKTLTHCNMIEIADRVSAELRQENGLAALATNPNAIWWIQLAAQAGCTHSLEALLSLKAKDYPYVCYALGIISEFGILHSKMMQPNHDRSEFYFHLARCINLQTYLQIGINEHFACKEVIALLQRVLNSSPTVKPMLTLRQ